jgi:hypothetical protein
MLRVSWQSLLMRQEWDYQQYIEFGSHVGQPGHRHGVQ